MRRDIWRVLAKLSALGHSILVVDKNVADLTRLASRHFVIEKGRVVWSGSSDELKSSPEVHTNYLSV